MSSLKIYPLHLGTITRQAMSFCYQLEPGKLMDAPIISWYIDGSDKKILVDTGGVAPSKAHPRWAPYRREEGQSIENVLRKFGLACEDIDIVIMTHLHWDHCGGNGLFRKAKIIVQQEELTAARSPFPISAHTFGHIRNMIEEIDYTIISGDKEIAEGVTAILTPGHSYGMQGVLVEAKNGRYLIAGDTFGLFKNLEQNPPMISGSYVDLRKYYESIEKIMKLSAFILPGHDFKVFEKEVYD